MGLQGTCDVPSGAQRVMGAAILTSGSFPAPSVMTGAGGQDVWTLPAEELHRPWGSWKHLEKKALPDSLVDKGGGWSPEVRDCPHRWARDRGCF